jgi:hypothetical protein
VAAAAYAAGSATASPYAVLLGPDTATVRFAGPTPSAVFDRSTLTITDPAAASVYVCLGSNGTDLVFLDLAAAPGVLTVDGDPRAATALANSLMSQLAPHRVAHIEQWPRALEELEDDGRLTFLIWPRPDAENAVRLHRAAEQRPWLRIIVLGDTNGTRWPLTVTADGVVSSLALGLTASSSSLPEQVPPRTAIPVPPPAPVAESDPEPAPSLDEHPGLLPLPERHPDLSIEPFAPSAHAPALAGAAQ